MLTKLPNVTISFLLIAAIVFALRTFSASTLMPLFTAGHKLLSFAYSETDGRVFSYGNWIQSTLDPPRTIEAFSAHLIQLRKKAVQQNNGGSGS